MTIAEVGTVLPFDVFAKGTLFYHDSHIGNEQFCSDFKKTIAHCLANPNSPDSSVLETLSGRGTLFEIIHRAEMLRRIDALIDECDWNHKLLLDVMKLARKNKKYPEKKEWVTSRFGSAAAELLVVDRYLDEDKSFYKTIGTCLISVSALNEMLSSWRTDDKGVEKWFEKNGDLYKKRLKKHKEALSAAQRKLSVRISDVVL